MASHLTHQVLAEDVVAGYDPKHPFLTKYHNYLVLGAQGPDMFYHNQRTPPYGIQFGVSLHRKNYGRFISTLVQYAQSSGIAFESDLGSFVYGYATHAVLDRKTHPFINFFSGWVDPDVPESSKFKSMHPFFERIIDVLVLSRFRNISPNEFDFYSQVSCGRELPDLILKAYRHGLFACFKKPRHDDRFDERLRNAYMDAMGYYRYSNRVTAAGLREGARRERAGDLGPRWLAVLHPFVLEEDVDYLNEGRSLWNDPCDPECRSASSFWDLFLEAKADSQRIFESVRRGWNGALPLFAGDSAVTMAGEPVAHACDDGDGDRTASGGEAWAKVRTDDQPRSLEARIGNGGLSDERNDSNPCSKRFSRPLPLARLIDKMKRRIDSDDLPKLLDFQGR